MRKLDYALISHFHGDHMGVIVPGSPRSPNGYQLSGITEVAESGELGRSEGDKSTPAEARKSAPAEARKSAPAAGRKSTGAKK